MLCIGCLFQTSVESSIDSGAVHRERMCRWHRPRGCQYQTVYVTVEGKFSFSQLLLVLWDIEQFGFSNDKGIRNGVFILSMLLERYIEINKDLYLCFVNYSKTFDKT